MLPVERHQIAADVVAEYVDELVAGGTPPADAELLGVLLWLELTGEASGEA
jgi:hypothetical protein